MASRLLTSTFFHLHTPLFAAGVAGSALAFYPNLLQSYRQQHLLRLDTAPIPSSVREYQQKARTPVVTRNGGLNARAVRQMSLGSILGMLQTPTLLREESLVGRDGGADVEGTGLVAGLGLSVFSKPLVLLIGLAIVGVQTAESYGIHLVPYSRVQKYFKGVDVRSAVQNNVALKVSFGLMFALTGFTNF